MKSIRKTSNGAGITIADKRIYLGGIAYSPDNRFCVGFDTMGDLAGIRHRKESCRECLTHLEGELGIFVENPEYRSVLDLGPAYGCWKASAEFRLPFNGDVYRALAEGAQFMRPPDIPGDMLSGKIFGNPREGEYSVVLYAGSVGEASRLGEGMDRAFREVGGNNGYIEYLVSHGCGGILEPLIGLPVEWAGMRTPLTNRDPEAIQRVYLDAYNMLRNEFY